MRKNLAGRYYQLLSGHAATGTHQLRFGITDTDECWWCASGEPPVPTPLYQVSGVDPPASKTVEGCGGGVRVGAPTHSLGQAPMGCKGSGGGFRVFAHDKSRVIGTDRVPPEEEEMGEETEGEQGGPGAP